MDRHLQERLVGAAVLVAAAVILIPEMLSGPAVREAEPIGTEIPALEGGVRTYTIDLDRARSAVQPDSGQKADQNADQKADQKADETVSVVETPAPPPETAPADEPEPAAVAQAPTVSEAPEKPASAPPDRQLPWAVQVGSFASPATADRVSKEFKQRGYASFVVPFKSGAQTLYRVRIGPFPERGGADAVVQKLKRERSAATVVANT